MLLVRIQPIGVHKLKGTLTANKTHFTRSINPVKKYCVLNSKKCDPHSNFSGKKKPVTLNKRFESVNHRVMSYKEKEEMKNIMICKNKERETMRFRGFLERLLTIPFSEKQNIHAIEEVHADA